jgi:tetratricopeptide (TPR) repeat protein
MTTLLPVLPRRFPFASLAFASLAFTGCVGNTKLDEMDKARLIKEKRLEARDLLEKWRASDGQNISLLEKFMKVNRETTEIAPATCPRCWASYGESLSMIGFYYWGIYQDILEEAETVKSPQKKKELLKESEEYLQEWHKYFTLSNQAYETHFRSKEVFSIHPYSYERVMRHYELMGGYERALTYLQKYLDSYTNIDEPNRQKIEKLRRIYKQELQRQKERGLKEGEAPPVRRRIGSPPPEAHTQHQGVRRQAARPRSTRESEPESASDPDEEE